MSDFISDGYCIIKYFMYHCKIEYNQRVYTGVEITVKYTGFWAIYTDAGENIHVTFIHYMSYYVNMPVLIMLNK